MNRNTDDITEQYLSIAGDSAVRSKLNLSIRTESEEELVNSFLDLLTRYNINDYSAVLSFSRSHILAILYLVKEGFITENELRTVIFSTSYETRTDLLLSKLTRIETEGDIDIFSPLIGAVSRISGAKNKNEFATDYPLVSTASLLNSSFLENTFFYGKEVYNHLKLTEGAVNLVQNDNSYNNVLFNYCYNWGSTSSEVLKAISANGYSTTGRIFGTLKENANNYSIVTLKTPTDEIASGSGYYYGSKGKYEKLYKPHRLSVSRYRIDNGFSIKLNSRYNSFKTFFSDYNVLLASESINDDILSNVLYKIADEDFNNRETKLSSVYNGVTDEAAGAFATYLNYMLASDYQLNKRINYSIRQQDDSKKIFNIYSKLGKLASVSYNSVYTSRPTETTIFNDHTYGKVTFTEEVISSAENYTKSTYYSISKIENNSVNIDYILANFYNGLIMLDSTGTLPSIVNKNQYDSSIEYYTYKLDADDYSSEKKYFTKTITPNSNAQVFATIPNHTTIENDIFGSSLSTDEENLVGIIKPYINSLDSNVLLDNRYFMRNILKEISPYHSMAIASYISQYMMIPAIMPADIAAKSKHIEYIMSILSTSYLEQENKALTKELLNFDILIDSTGTVTNFGTCNFLDMLNDIIDYLKSAVIIPTSATEIIADFSRDTNGNLSVFVTNLNSIISDMSYLNVRKAVNDTALDRLIFYYSKEIMKKYISYLSDGENTTTISSAFTLSNFYLEYYRLLFYIRHMVLAFAKYGKEISANLIYKGAIGEVDPTNENVDIDAVINKIYKQLTYDTFYDELDWRRKTPLLKICNELDSLKVSSSNINGEITNLK